MSSRSVPRGGASLTAEVVAYFRAVETLRAAEQRVLNDPFAHQFLSGPLKRSFRRVRRQGHWLYDAVPGLSALATTVVCRHRTFDDWMLEALAEGAQQLALLGAGYDMRLLRHPECRRVALGVELDLAPTQIRKLEVISRLADESPPTESVVYEPVDFQSIGLREGLVSAGWNAQMRSWAVLEGVSMYISPEAFAELLRTVGDLVARDSELVLDYWSPDLEGASVLSTWMDQTSPLFSWIGEPLIGRMTAAELRSAAERTGWAVDALWGPAEYRQRYALGRRRPYPSLRVARLRRRVD